MRFSIHTARAPNHTRRGAPTRRQRCLPFLKRCAAQVFAAEFEQIECEQHGLGLGLAAVAQAVEYRDAILTADHDLAVDQARPARERDDRGGNRRIAAGQSRPRRVSSRTPAGSRRAISRKPAP